MKGDWPALTKLGNLRRHHLRVTWTSDAGAGICHYCKAGMPGNADWHNLSFRNMAAMRIDAPAPWSPPPALIRYVPHSMSQAPYFFRIDLFHLMHKGVLADVAANAIVSCFDYGLFGCTNLKMLMAFVYDDAKHFCQQNRLELHMSQLTTNQLGLTRTTDYPTGSWFKGNDTRSLTKYMEWKLTHTLHELFGPTLEYFTEIVGLLSYGNKFMHLLYNAGLWLSTRQRDDIISSGDKFVASFMSLAQTAYDNDL
ncbi:unnamed protein product, partial [Symbiodinium necroappetens]